MGHIGLAKMARAFGLMAGLGLAACAQGPDRTPLELEVLNAVREGIRKKTPAEPPVLTRALLNTVPVPQLEMIVERVDLRDYLVPQDLGRGTARRSGDGTPGRIEQWRAVDDITFTFRDGMLVASRGVPFDGLLSAAVAADGQGAAGPARGGARVMQYRGGDNEVFTLSLSCHLENLGPVTLEVVEEVYPTTHLRESCEGAGGTITNDYWVDRRDGRLWQSRQWLGPNTGYIRFRLVHLGLGARKNVTLMRGS
ncbi:YjbF family lipoprotein [Tritonibacter multivorans]|nr:YjbF family lipoprotein [Tritonibacter multivorans]MDA7422724.1 YjbF family lipoprotein [Tritonibacter multivorans]